jgi:RNA-directed DNA polymerase
MEEPEVEGDGQYLLNYTDGVSSVESRVEEAHCKSASLMAEVVGRENMTWALDRVRSNRGAAGVDGMTVDELPAWLRKHWALIKNKLLDGSYRPRAVKRVDIPKPDGGMRMLGIPTVLDRLIQQALAQVLTPIFDPHFSEASYGFRPRRSAIQAVRQAQEYQHEGKRWIVDLDLEKFFDVVNHDKLLQCVRERVSDPIVLKLIRSYLRAGMMAGGVASQRTEGTPQGGPLSPLLSNILLDRFDRELKQRGHSFVRYADDCNIYLKSRRAAERVLASVTKWLEEKLLLRVNRSKSKVDRPWNRKFLGYSVTNHRKTKLRVAKQSVKRFRARVKAKMVQGKGRNLRRFIDEDLNPILRGWANYYRAVEARSKLDELDCWIRRRLRCIVWKQWKLPWTRRRNLMRMGVGEVAASRTAFNGRGAWYNSGMTAMNMALPTKFFDQVGLVKLQQQAVELRR